jgi:DNA-binding transcriptional regulator YiaG
MSPAGQGDNNATFLAEFRALRDHAGLDDAELAARAHYPSEVLQDTEAGPALPGLPILAAYVRACDGDVAEWEERWRQLTEDNLTLLAPETDRGECGLPVRPAGASPAAKAGARAGVTIAPADVHDPERIKAALRAHRAKEDSGNGSVSGTAFASGATATMLANGQHHRRHEQGPTATRAADYASSDSPAAATTGQAASSWSSATYSDSDTTAGFGTSAEPYAATTEYDADQFAGDAQAWSEPSISLGDAAANTSHAPAEPAGIPRTSGNAGRFSRSARLKLVAFAIIVLIGCVILIAVI